MATALVSDLLPYNAARLKLRQLLSERWVMQPAARPMRRAIESAFERLGLPLPPHPIETISMLATANLVDQTEMLAVLPTTVARYYLRLGALAVLPVGLPARLGPFGLITAKERARTPAADDVISTLRKAALGNNHPGFAADPLASCGQRRHRHWPGIRASLCA